MSKIIATNQHWQFWIDRGGTFTDIVAQRPNGELLSRKFLSENPEHYPDAAVYGINTILGEYEASGADAKIEVVKMGTTVGTNALLERKGANVALFISQGFGDCLRIAYQNRPDIFALDIQSPDLLYQQVVEISERISAQGEVLQVLNKQQACEQMQAVYDDGIASIAIVLMHAWRYPQHELQLAEIATEIGFSQISVSHQVSPLMKIVGRGDTTVVDAYLSPLLRRYVDQVAVGLKLNDSSSRLLFMQSSGSLTEAESFQGKDSILSGPAGGVIGAIACCKKAGLDKIIAFDMGGTSTDVAHYAGVLEHSFETEVAGIRMRAPMINIHTVAAGGGSILHFDGLRFRVGPESASANPGPASYRQGGPLTVTDANVMLGRLPLFPKVFGQQGNLALDSERVKQLFQQLSQRINQGQKNTGSPERVAEGFLAIAIANMANAIKKISIQKGYNVSEYTLCCYGAAGGQHACQIADKLGMTQVFMHRFSGVLSAYGMGLAKQGVMQQKTLEAAWQCTDEMELKGILFALEQQGREQLIKQNINPELMCCQYTLRLRYQGTDTALAVDYADKASMLNAFVHSYQQQFGFSYDDRPLIIEAAVVEVSVASMVTESVRAPIQSEKPVQPIMQVSMFAAGSYHQTPVYQRHQLAQGTEIAGPAVLVEATATIVVELGWQALIEADQVLMLTRVEAQNNGFAIGSEADPVMLEIFNKLFMSIAEQMGFVLQNTASSVNIKERLDFSCALFDSAGELIANAPHIPVHLGSIGASVQALIQDDELHFNAGDVFMINSPYQGGTHLPDITIITPVFDRAGSQCLFFVASRGHHADIGGISPGSMPANSRHIDEEGLLHTGLKIVKQGLIKEQTIRQWLASGVYPARNPEQNVADLRAQIAANEKGRQELLKMVEHYSLATVLAYMGYVQDHAAACVAKVISALVDGEARHTMDNGAKIKITISVDSSKQRVSIDFTGTSKQLTSNFNAPSAVCKAAVIYVFRTLVQDDIPLNAGCLRAVDIIIPEGSMLKPQYPAAVVAGNVETSQAIVDCLYQALGVLAGSQGTMNNITLGNQQFQYYETICGGAGASKNADGCDAVQTHMTNSRMTDPEVLEWRFPITVEQFSLRPNSGGIGLKNGGDGVIRRLRCEQVMTSSILSEHRTNAPAGIKGGGVGKLGRNSVIRVNGSVETLAACQQLELNAGDVLQIETPGGGAYGDPLAKDNSPKNNV